ncbi:hypothetical protein HDU96_006223 [Phlyctochytrium bullatum]|nr:hypothetical protein HDU96_006223 [Phlyctochytrium bullatum]
MSKAKLQLQGETDYFHLLSALACDSSKLLKVNFQQDFVLDSDLHTLWDAGLTLTIRSTRDEPSNNDGPLSQKSITIVLKETKVDVNRPYFEVIEREEKCGDLNVVDQVLRGGLPAASSLGELCRETLEKFPGVEIKCIGSFQNVRHVFEWEQGITLEVDRCTFFPTGYEAFFCRFDSNETVIHKCLTFISNLQVSYCVHMASKSSLFFSYLKQSPPNVSQLQLPTISSLDRAAIHNAITSQQPNTTPAVTTAPPPPRATQAPAPPANTTPQTVQSLLSSNNWSDFNSHQVPAIPQSRRPSAATAVTTAQSIPLQPASRAQTPHSISPRPETRASSVSSTSPPASAARDTTTSSSTNGGAGGSGEDFLQLQRRRNREASARYRKRKVEEAQSQQDVIQGLRKRIEELESENRMLHTQIKVLKGNFKPGIIGEILKKS